ncbi:hypothetical protein [Halocola ammonii]
MLRIKTIEISNRNEGEIERAIRNYSLKRHTPPDFIRSYTYIPRENKYFLAKESEDMIEFTRIRLPLEMFLPKVIVFVSKENWKRLQIYLGVFTSSILVLLLLTFILNLYYWIFLGENRLEITLGVSLLLGFIYLLTIIQVKLTLKSLKKALSISKKVEN